MGAVANSKDLSKEFSYVVRSTKEASAGGGDVHLNLLGAICSGCGWSGIVDDSTKFGMLFEKEGKGEAMVSSFVAFVVLLTMGGIVFDVGVAAVIVGE
jgi:hypothetical protein